MLKRWVNRWLIGLTILAGIPLSVAAPAPAQRDNLPRINVTVDLVQLNVAVSDKKGHYVTGLRPQNFVVTEDGIHERIASFGEGNEAVRSVSTIQPQSAKAPGIRLANPGSAPSDTFRAKRTATGTVPSQVTGGPVSEKKLAHLVSGANVFVLFDTSNYMYRGFVFAQDAIADFVRSLQGADKVAFYSYSRDLSRATLLTSNRSDVLRGVRSTVVGDNAALYNCLLTTVKDASRLSGRKIIVVFSNGPDNASVVSPEEVAELAESTGTTIYMVSTERAHLEPISNAVFQRMTAATGGKVYFARNWNDEQKAFSSIRSDLAHLYSLSYYPAPNPNRGWRKIRVRVVGHKNYRVRTRDGYRPQVPRFADQTAISSAPYVSAK